MNDGRATPLGGRDGRRPAGTTSWEGSATELGTAMRSYSDRPVMEEPVWQPQVPAYFFTGGLAGASSGLAFLARMRGNDRLADRRAGSHSPPTSPAPRS